MSTYADLTPATACRGAARVVDDHGLVRALEEVIDRYRVCRSLRPIVPWPTATWAFTTHRSIHRPMPSMASSTTTTLPGRIGPMIFAICSSMSPRRNARRRAGNLRAGEGTPPDRSFESTAVLCCRRTAAKIEPGTARPGTSRGVIPHVRASRPLKRSHPTSISSLKFEQRRFGQAGTPVFSQRLVPRNRYPHPEQLTLIRRVPLTLSRPRSWRSEACG